MSRTKGEGIQENILSTAYLVFGSKGFQATTIKDIADKAAISTGAIYMYFKDKEQLFMATVSYGWSLIIREIEELEQAKLFQEHKITELINRGFSILASALPLIQGLLFEANKLQILEKNIQRVCIAIDKLLTPEYVNTESEIWKKGQAKRLIRYRIVILGLLTSTSLLLPGQFGSDAENYKSVIRSMIIGIEQ